MASGTKIRRLTRLLEDCDGPLWVIDSSGQLAYLSAGCAAWLGIDVESLVDRRSVAGTPVSDDPLDRLAASLSPPPGIVARGTASLRVHPSAVAAHRPDSREVRYVRLGDGAEALTLCVAGNFDDRLVDPELQDAVAVRQRLDTWRKRHATLATIATAGVSAAARRMRRKIRIAGSLRTDVGFFGPPGSGTESIARRVHQLSAPGESLVVIDGPLMDAELLDASMMPLLHRLTDAADARATALLRGLDEMPMEAQHRLVSLLDTFSDRLRLLAMGGPSPKTLAEAMDKSEGAEILSLEEAEASVGICSELAELLCSMTIGFPPLAQRVEDIPLIATAMLDRRHANGEGTAERISRAALDALVIYPWPRNLDELDEAIRHAIRTAPGGSIGIDHLPLAVRSYRPGEPAGSARGTVPLDVAVRRYERRLINEAVEASDGNRAEAARRLGISRARLLRKLEDVGDDQAGDPQSTDTKK
jgi:transcriptional regulator with AAA-type ATPase domain